MTPLQVEAEQSRVLQSRVLHSRVLQRQRHAAAAGTFVRHLDSHFRTRAAADNPRCKHALGRTVVLARAEVHVEPTT